MARKTRKQPSPVVLESPDPPAEQQQQPALPLDRRALLLVCALLVLSVLAVYSRVRGQSFINYEDNRAVVENETVRKGLSGETLRAAFAEQKDQPWQPLTTISHLVDVRLFGMNAAAHKLVSVALHAAAAVLLLLFLVRTTGALWPSAIVAGLFALHPTRVEPVVWVAARAEVLCGFFWMLSLWLYAGYVRHERKPGRMALVVLAFAGGLLAKPAGVIALPLVLLLVDFWPLRRISVWDPERLKPLLMEKLALFALLYPAIAMTLRTAEWGVPSWLEGLRMLVWPSGLAVPYPQTAGDPTAAVVALVLLGGLLVFSPKRPYLLTGVLWYLCTLLPLYRGTADRFLYVPAVGLFIAAVWWLRERVNVLFAVPVVLVCAVLSWIQAGYWTNSETLFRRTLAVTSGNAVAHRALATALLARGEAPEAALNFRAAAAINARDVLAQHGLGEALLASGDGSGAEAAFRAAVAIDPSFKPALRQLSQLQMATGRAEEAIPLLEKAQKLENDPQTSAELAIARKDFAGAMKHYAEALVLSPADAELRNNYAAVLAREGKNEEALAQYNEAIRLRSDHYEARMNVAALLSRMGRQDDAVKQLIAAAALKPTSPEPNVYLALVYSNQSKYKEAVQQIDTALSRDAASANRLFSNAVRMQYDEKNLEQYRVFLQSRIK